MRRQVLRLIQGLLVLSFVITGCAATMLPPVRSSGPAFSEEGVHIAVVRQSCNQTREPARLNQDLVDLTLAIEVGNPTNHPVAVHRERLLLVPSDGSAVRTSTAEAAGLVSVESGVTEAFTLRFMARGTSCSHEMRLESDSVLDLGGRSIKIGAVRFVPAWSL